MNKIEKLELKISDHPDYVKVHFWLKKYFGKANKCENDKCSNKSKLFHWALKKGCDYEKKRENFIQLCSSCHKLYDMTDETRIKMSLSRIGELHPRSKLTLSQVNEIRNSPRYHGVQRELAAKYNVSEHNISKILKNKSWTKV